MINLSANDCTYVPSAANCGRCEFAIVRVRPTVLRRRAWPPARCSRRSRRRIARSSRRVLGQRAPCVLTRRRRSVRRSPRIRGWRPWSCRAGAGWIAAGLADPQWTFVRGRRPGRPEGPDTGICLVRPSGVDSRAGADAANSSGRIRHLSRAIGDLNAHGVLQTSPARAGTTRSPFTPEPENGLKGLEPVNRRVLGSSPSGGAQAQVRWPGLLHVWALGAI